MTDTTRESEAERAVREAHETCPCRIGYGEFNRKRLCLDIGCHCYWSTEESKPPTTDGQCSWPGHAAIDRAVLEARKAQMQQAINLWEAACAAFNHKPLHEAIQYVRDVLKAERDRLVALLDPQRKEKS